MKKLGSLFLVIIMLLALCACSEESANKIPSEYVGTWKGSECWGGSVVDGVEVKYYDYTTLLLKEDGTGTYTVDSYGQDEPNIVEFEWSYDQTNHTIDILLPKQNRTIAFEIKENDGKTYLQIGNDTPLYRE